MSLCSVCGYQGCAYIFGKEESCRAAPFSKAYVASTARGDAGGTAVAVAFVLVFVAFVAWYGRIIGSHLADGYPSCAFGPRGTTCSPASFPSDQARH